MNRSDFFRHLVLGGASAILLSRHKGNGPKEKREIKLSTPYIAGFQFYEGCGAEGQLKVNDSLTLKREPENRHDSYAIEVFHKEKKLGYIPREENKVVARMMDQKINVKGRIKKIRPDSSPWHRVKMKVYYELVQET